MKLLFKSVFPVPNEKTVRSEEGSYLVVDGYAIVGQVVNDKNVYEYLPKRKEFKSSKTMPSWYAEAWSLPKEERAKLRSKTFPGIAKVMADQWGKLIKS